jgi:hypothetical protein
MSGKRKTISTEEFDRRVDAGEDIFDIVGAENIKIVPNHEVLSDRKTKSGAVAGSGRRDPGAREINPCRSNHPDFCATCGPQT